MSNQVTQSAPAGLAGCWRRYGPSVRRVSRTCPRSSRSRSPSPGDSSARRWGRPTRLQSSSRLASSQSVSASSDTAAPDSTTRGDGVDGHVLDRHWIARHRGFRRGPVATPAARRVLQEAAAAASRRSRFGGSPTTLLDMTTSECSNLGSDQPPGAPRSVYAMSPRLALAPSTIVVRTTALKVGAGIGPLYAAADPGVLCLLVRCRLIRGARAVPRVLAGVTSVKRGHSASACCPRPVTVNWVSRPRSPVFRVSSQSRTAGRSRYSARWRSRCVVPLFLSVNDLCVSTGPAWARTNTSYSSSGKARLGRHMVGSA